MKTSIITMAALCWAASTSQQTMAAGWQRPAVESFQKIENLAKGYLYNVGTRMFLVNGNDYNTTASLGYEGLEMVFEDYSAANEGANAWKIRFTSNNGLLFIGHANGTYYDGELKSSNMGHNLWAITAAADGSYRIAIAASDEQYAPNAENGDPDWFFGWGGEVKADGSLSQTKCVYNIDPTASTYANTGVDWRLVSPSDYALYAARTALYELLVEADKAGVGTDQAGKVYNDAAATVEQLQDALALQQEMLNNASLAGATDENPKDATPLIQNADCSSTDGWDQTASFGKQGASYSNGDVAIAGFLERWCNAGDGSKTLGAGTLSQTINKLPVGRYRLEADAIACNQGNGKPVEGIALFAEFGDERLACEVSTGNGKPEHYTIDFMLNDVADLTVGFAAAEGNTANWIAVDNFRLTYYGVSDNPYLFPLKEKIAQLEKYEADGATYWYSTETQHAWATMLKRANAAREGKPAEMQDMLVELDEFMRSLKAEIDAYGRLRDMVARVEEAAITFAEFEQLCDMLAVFVEELNDAYDDGTYSVDDINGLDNVYNDIIGQGVRADLAPGKELTVLIQNPTFDNNDNSGWEGTRPSTQFEVGEIWNAGLDMHQTIKNLPAGQYTLRVNAFYRHGKNEDHYADVQAGNEQIMAVLYGNLQQVELKSILSGWSDENMTGGVAVTLADGSSKYVPNNREGFNEVQARYPNELKVIVANDGDDLTFGIKTLGTVPAYSWTIFDSFTLTYDGMDMDGYLASLKAAADKLKANRDSKLATMPLTQDIDAAVTSLAVEAYAMDGSNETSAITAKIKELSALSARLDSLADEVLAYQQLVTYFEGASVNVNDEAFTAAFGRSLASAYTPAATPWADAAAMEDEQNALRVAWTQYVQSQGRDVSDAIINRGYTDVDGNDSGFGWSYDSTLKGQAGTSRVGAHEYWNCNFDHYQEIPGLKAGYYVVSVTGFYRAGYADVAAASRAEGVVSYNARLYATVGDTTWARPLMSAFDGAPTQKSGSNENFNLVGDSIYYTPNNMETFNEYVAMGLYTPAEEETDRNVVCFHIATEGQNVTIGIRKKTLIAGDWSIWDNFRLVYLGESAEGTGVTVATGTQGQEVAYFTVGGLRLDRPQRGINIVRTTLPDGTVQTRKVLVR